MKPVALKCVAHDDTILEQQQRSRTKEPHDRLQREVSALRRLRRAQLGLPQKIVLLLLFVLIFAPVLARSLWAEVGLPDDVCTAEYSTWPPHRPPAENVTTPVNATAGDNSTLTIDGGIGGATNGSLGLEI